MLTIKTVKMNKFFEEMLEEQNGLQKSGIAKKIKKREIS